MSQYLLIAIGGILGLLLYGISHMLFYYIKNKLEEQEYWEERRRVLKKQWGEPKSFLDN